MHFEVLWAHGDTIDLGQLLVLGYYARWMSAWAFG